MAKKYMGLNGRALAVAITVTTGLLFMTFGYGQGDIGGLLTVEAFRERFPRIDVIGNRTSLSVVQLQGITVAIWNIGCFASAILTIFLSDLLGRKRILLLGIVFIIAGKAVQASSYGFGQYLAGRFIAGFGNGFTTSTVPAYQAECTKAHRRGTVLMVSSSACIAFGLATAYWVDFGMAYTDPSSASWRVPVALHGVFVIPAFIMMLMLPESPRWLILQGREQEALDVLGALADAGPESSYARQEFLQIKDTIIQMSKASVTSVFKNGEYRYLQRTLLVVLLQSLQQWTGINLFLQYLAEIFITQTRYSPGTARLLAGCSATELFLASFITVVGIDRFWGRRSLSMTGSAGMAVCMVVLCVMNYLDTTASQRVFTVFVFVFNTFFAIGWQGLSWLWAVELTPLPIRGPANAMATAANWLSNFVVVLITPIAFRNITWRTYVIFAVFNAITVPIIYFLYPETGCRSLEEVDVLFHHASQAGKPWTSVVKVARREPLWYGKDGTHPFLYEDSAWHRERMGEWNEKRGSYSSGGLGGTTSDNSRGGSGEKTLLRGSPALEAKMSA